MPAKYRRFIIALLVVPLLFLLAARYQIASRDHPPPVPASPAAPVTPAAIAGSATGECSDDNSRRGLALLRGERDHLIGTVNFASPGDSYSLGSMDEVGETLGRLDLPKCLQAARKSLLDAIGSAHSAMGQMRDQDTGSFELHAALLSAMQYHLDRAESDFSRIDAGLSGQLRAATPLASTPGGKTPGDCADDSARRGLSQLHRQRERIAAAVDAADPADRYSLRGMDDATEDLSRLALPECMSQARTALTSAAEQARRMLRRYSENPDDSAVFEFRDAMRAAMQADIDAADSELARLDGSLGHN